MAGVRARSDLAPDTMSGAGLRARIVAAAVETTTREGWSKVTMARLAAAIGVSRQTVYNEVGAKPALAEAMVFHELERFLGVVASAFDEHPDDIVAALHSACWGILEAADDNALLHAIVSATHGADTELLPLLTTNSESLLAAAKAVVLARMEPYGLGLADHELQIAVDTVVRAVLSHVMQPSGTPRESADGLAWIAGRVLRIG